MSALPALAVYSSDFSVDGDFDGKAITVRFKGNADLRARQTLETVLTTLHREAKRLLVRAVVIDFDKLEFMNSSCFKNFVAWINRVQEMEQRSRYSIKFISNPSLHWQKRSLTALQCFAVDLVEIDS